LIKKTYLFFRTITILTIAILFALVVLLSHDAVIPYLAQKYLKDYGARYSKITGNLISGITINDLQYKDSVSAKYISIHYSFLALLGLTPTIDTLVVRGLHVDIDNLPKSDNNTSSFNMFGFKISKLALKDAEVIFDKKTVKFNLNAKSIDYEDALHVEKLAIFDAVLQEDEELLQADLNSSNFKYNNNIIDAKKLTINLNSSYGVATFDGSIEANRFTGNASVTIADVLSKEYLSFLNNFPKSLNLKLEITPQKVMATTFIDKVSFVFDEKLGLKNADVALTYFLEDHYFTTDIDYDVSYLDFEAAVKESVLFTTTGAYQSKLEATLTKSPMELPFKSFGANVTGDAHTIIADINTTKLTFSLLGKEYQHFDIQGQGDDVSLSFLDGIPSILKKDILSFQTAAVMEISPLSIVGTIETEDLYSKINGNFELNPKNSLYRATLNPKPENALFKNYPMKRVSPLELVYFNSKSTDFLNIDAKLLNISLFKNGEILNGWGNVSSSNFDLLGDLNDSTGAKSLSLSANIPSIYTLLSELDLNSSLNIPFYDAEVNIHSTLKLSDKLEIKSRIDVPWYAFQPDSQTTYAGVDSFIEVTSNDKQISIDSYTIDVMDHKVYSKKDSKISLDKDGNIDIGQLWIYDNLLLTGFINPTKRKGNIQVKSERFTYHGKEGNVTAKTDINASLDANGTQTVTGNIELIDGVITYMPRKDYSITDEDIIIIQDIKETSQVNRFVTIHITSLKPIAYKIKNVDLLFTPDITIFQEPKTPLVLLGMVTVDKGKVASEGKAFELAKSEIYFYGENNFNPYLNLKLHYTTLNDIDIEIFVTNNLDSPVVIFSSNPAMSQNDIMSYILFGQPSSSVFDGSSEGGSKVLASSLLLGTGLKQIFNKASALKVDTLNILTTKEGSLGYEIGSRINQDLRVVYKNDTISSVIVQYSINKSMRLDVDVHETGQGVSIIYVKDYK